MPRKKIHGKHRIPPGVKPGQHCYMAGRYMATCEKAPTCQRECFTSQLYREIDAGYQAPLDDPRWILDVQDWTDPAVWVRLGREGPA